MTGAARVALRLDLDSAADPIRGVVTDANDVAQEFVGWLGLASAIERLLTAGSQRGAQSKSQGA